jgi:hypothetical protein
MIDLWPHYSSLSLMKKGRGFRRALAFALPET